VSRFCDGCAGFRARLGVASCKSTPLCKMIDSAVADRHPSLSISELVRMAGDTERGQIAANAAADRRTAFPETWVEFREVSLDLHRLLLRDAEPAVAGRFRSVGERGFYGGEGRHAREGSPSDRIECELRDLAEKCQPTKTEDKALFTRWGARFLERFFAIHPFVDGNGRVARLLLDVALRETGRWRFDQTRPNSRQRSRYRQALEWAHLQEPRNGCDGRQPSADPYGRLASWLDRHFIDVPEGWEMDG
jgi:fido (protein-threonine AMPylation protein)